MPAGSESDCDFHIFSTALLRIPRYRNAHTAAFNGIIRDYEPSQDIADHGETVDIQGTVWSSVVMSREPSGYVRSSYPTFSHPMPAGGLFLNDPTFTIGLIPGCFCKRK